MHELVLGCCQGRPFGVAGVASRVVVEERLQGFLGRFLESFLKSSHRSSFGSSLELPGGSEGSQGEATWFIFSCPRPSSIPKGADDWGRQMSYCSRFAPSSIPKGAAGWGGQMPYFFPSRTKLNS